MRTKCNVVSSAWSVCVGGGGGGEDVCVCVLIPFWPDLQFACFISRVIKLPLWCTEE